MWERSSPGEGIAALLVSSFKFQPLSLNEWPPVLLPRPGIPGPPEWCGDSLLLPGKAFPGGPRGSRRLWYSLL